MGLTKKCELMYYTNWGLAVSFKLKFTSVGVGALDDPYIQTCEIFSFEET